ncbi:MAG: hypothetical protein WAO76_17690 [Georgfuchsia sp.]
MNSQSLARTADFGLLIFLVLCSCMIAGMEATACAWLAWFLLSLPGLVFFGNRHASLAQLALCCAAGIAVSLLATVIVGLSLGKLSLPGLIAIPLVLAFVAYRLRQKTLLHFLPAMPTTAWQITVPLAALLLSLLPLYLVGAEFEGSHHFHAYFNADFFKHIANSEELARGVFPPINPFAAAQNLHYYWASYLLPAMVIRLSGFAVSGVNALLTVVLLQTTTLGLLAFNLCFRLSRGKALPAAIAGVLTMLSLSLDGLASLWNGYPKWSTDHVMQTVNQEALDFTQFWGPSTQLAGSTWQRLCLYLPQHQLAILIFIAWAILFVAATSPRTDALPWSRALLLLPLPMISIFVGTLAAVVIVFSECIRVRRLGVALLWAALLAASILLLFPTDILTTSVAGHAADPFLAMGDEASAPLLARIAWMGPQLLATFGVTLLLGLTGAGIAARRASGLSTLATVPIVTLTVGLAAYLGAEILFDGRLRIETELKTSFVLLAGLMMGSALFLSASPSDTGIWRSFRVVCFILLLGGMVSPLHDVIWHSSSFQPDEVVVPNADMEALRWIRKNTPADAVFQQPLEQPFLLGGKDAWVAIFGARRVAVAERAGGIPESRQRAATILFDPSIQRKERDRALQMLQVRFVYFSRSLVRGNFNRLAQAMADENRSIVFRSPDVMIVEYSIPLEMVPES